MLTIGSPGQRYIVEFSLGINSPWNVTDDEVRYHLNKFNVQKIEVSAGSNGYLWLDGEVEGSTRESAFIDLVALDNEGLDWWFVDGATPTHSSTQVGPTWKLQPFHHQPFHLSHVPWSQNSRPAIAFTNDTDKLISAIVSYGRL